MLTKMFDRGHFSLQSIARIFNKI